MDWIQFAVFFFGVFGLWLWQRAEHRADMRHTDARLQAILQAMAAETKDFHGRLCAIEERNKGK